MINFAANLNKMITAGLGGETEAPSTEVAVGHRIHYLDASGPVASFETNIVAPLKKLRVTMLPIQEGSGDPSPENVRPISGRDTVTLDRSGKNLFDQDTVYESYRQDDGSFIATGSQSANIRFRIPAAYIGQPLTFSAMLRIPEGSAITNIRVAAKTGGSTRNGTFVNGEDYSISRVRFTPETVEDYVNISYGAYGGGNMQFKNVQLERGTTATEFAPYSGISESIQLGQTVYGGTLDMVSGKLTVNRGFIASYDGEAIPAAWISDRDVYAPGATPTTGAQVCYELAEPVEIDLEPQQINTLIGVNNVWSDAGDMDVTYTYYEETEGY